MLARFDGVETNLMARMDQQTATMDRMGELLARLDSTAAAGASMPM